MDRHQVSRRRDRPTPRRGGEIGRARTIGHRAAAYRAWSPRRSPSPAAARVVTSRRDSSSSTLGVRCPAPAVRAAAGGGENTPAGELLLLGLTGCSKVCAVLCCQIVDAGTGNAGAKVCKLVSVVVHSELRKRRLATVLVSKAFAELLDDGRYDLSRYHSHAVHPATVKLLAELGFTDPPLPGAPIFALEIDDANREEITTALKRAHSGAVDPLRLNYALCKSPRRQGRPWCTPSPSAKLPQAVSANNAVAASS